MTVYRLTCRRYGKSGQPYDCRDSNIGLYSTIDKARITAKAFLGSTAKSQTFGTLECWTNDLTKLLKDEYIISKEVVF